MGMASDVQLLTIGEFSRMTFLTVKTLRHYHEAGLLEPARIDPAAGYRYYRRDAGGRPPRLIRRFRDLDLPIDDVRAVLAAARRGGAERRDRRAPRPDEPPARADPGHRRVAAPDARPTTGRTFPVAYRDEPAPHRAGDPRPGRRRRTSWRGGSRPSPSCTGCSASAGSVRTGTDGALFPTEFFTERRASWSRSSRSTAVPARLPGRVDGVRRAGGAARRRHLRRPDARPGPRVRRGRPVGARPGAASPTGRCVERYLPIGDEDDLLAHTTEVCWPVAG